MEYNHLWNSRVIKINSLFFQDSVLEAFLVQWLPFWEMDTVTRVQVLDQAVCISHSTKILGKSIHPSILLPAIGKQWDRMGFSNHGIATSLVDETSEFKPVKTPPKKDIISYPICAEGLVLCPLLSVLLTIYHSNIFAGA